MRREGGAGGIQVGAELGRDPRLHHSLSTPPSWAIVSRTEVLSSRAWAWGLDCLGLGFHSLAVCPWICSSTSLCHSLLAWEIVFTFSTLGPLCR